MPLVNYRLVLPLHVRDVYLPTRSAIYRACEFRGGADLSNYTDRPGALSASTISAMSQVSDAVPWTGEANGRALFKCFREDRGEKLSVAIITDSSALAPCRRAYYHSPTRSLRVVSPNYPSGRCSPSVISAISTPRLPSLPSRFHNRLTTNRRGVSPSAVLPRRRLRARISPPPSSKYLSSRFSSPIQVSIIASLISMRARARTSATCRVEHVFLPRDDAQVLPRARARSLTFGVHGTDSCRFSEFGNNKRARKSRFIVGPQCKQSPVRVHTFASLRIRRESSHSPSLYSTPCLSRWPFISFPRTPAISPQM